MTTGLQPVCRGAEDSCADTVRVRILPEPVPRPQVNEEPPVGGFDPYSTDVGAQPLRTTPRRTLDDMRRLSESILRNRRR